MENQIQNIIDYINNHEIYGLNEDEEMEKVDIEIDKEKGIIFIASPKYSIDYNRTLDEVMFNLNDVMGWGEELYINEMISEIERVFIVKEKK